MEYTYVLITMFISHLPKIFCLLEITRIIFHTLIRFPEKVLKRSDVIRQNDALKLFSPFLTTKELVTSINLWILHADIFCMIPVITRNAFSAPRHCCRDNLLTG